MTVRVGGGLLQSVVEPAFAAPPNERLIGTPVAKTASSSKHDGKNDGKEQLVCQNRKARFQFEVLETLEAGLVLQGTEVKVLRQGKMSLDESYARVIDGEVLLIGANIAEYSHGNKQNHEPKRQRKCLLHRREIRKLQQKTQQQGLALIPLQVYFARGLAKITLALCRGRKLHDKREHIKQKDARREVREA